jgi:hypothetical protein
VPMVLLVVLTGHRSHAFFHGRQRRKVLVVALAGALLSAWALSGCASGDRAGVMKAITTALKSSDPSLCHRLYTARWIETYTHPDGTSPCRQLNQEKVSFRNVSVTTLAISGSTATAAVAVRDHEHGFRALTVRLTDQGRWRLDAITDVQLDRDRFLDELKRLQIRPSVTRTYQRFIACEIGWVRDNVSTTEIEHDLVVGSGTFVDGSFRSCGALYRTVVTDMIGRGQSFTDSERACIARAFNNHTSHHDLRQLYVESSAGSPTPAWLLQRAQAAIAGCGGVRALN